MSLVEKYVAALEVLTGNAFQDEVCARLQSVIPGFQTIPAKGGDGGLDGFSGNGEVGYCCYGHEYDPAKAQNDYDVQVVDKFKSDMRRLFELVKVAHEIPAPNLGASDTNVLVAGKKEKIRAVAKKEFKHVDNNELESVLPPDKKIKHLRLLLNRFESRKIIGRLQAAFQTYIAQSKCRFVDLQAVLTIEGPKQLANQHHVDELTLSRAKQRTLSQRLKLAAELTQITDPKDFESKISLMKMIRPGHETAIEMIAESLRRDWRLALACERDLSDTASSLHSALEQGRRVLLTKVLNLMQESDTPWKELSKALALAEEILSPTLAYWYGDMLPSVCNGEIAMLIGECPIGWEMPHVQ